MKNWTKFFSSKGNVMRLNGHLASALSHCPQIELNRWRFRCVECHISTGTYPEGVSGPWHSHNEYQIQIPVSGKFRFLTGGQEDITLQGYAAAVIPWKYPHRWTCLRSGVLIGISLQLIPTPESMLNHGRLIDQVALIAGRNVKTKVLDLFSSSLESGDAALQSTKAACHLFLLLAQIMQDITTSSGLEGEMSHNTAAEVRGRETVAWVIRHMDDNLGAKMTHQSLASQIGISGRKLHRLFMKHVGESFHDYLLKRRLEEAQRLLVEKGHVIQIKEIAFMCGFASLSYFSTSFHRAYGVSPSQMLLPDVALKSGTTFQLYDALATKASAGAAATASKRASISAKSKARG